MTHPSTTPTIRTLVQSVLKLGDQLLWCEVVSRGRGEYDVHIVPHWDMSIASVERFDRMTDAVRRYTELSSFLRQSGWESVCGQDSTAAQVSAA